MIFCFAPQDIFIEMRSSGKITDMKIRQKKNDDGSFAVSVKLDCDLYEGEKAEISLANKERNK